MSRYEHGRILAVNEEALGSGLVADHAAGVTSLTVEDAVDFDEDGGWLRVGDQVVEYATVDDDTGTIVLIGALEVASEEGDLVEAWDPLYQMPSVELIAQVEVDGDDDNTDSLEATVAHHLVKDLSEGIRGLRGESVKLELDGGEWVIVDILGLGTPGATGTAFWQDAHPVTTVGPQTATLTHEPIPYSEHLSINGVTYGEADGWSRAGQTITISETLARADDEIRVEYAYRVGVTPPGPEVIVPFGADSWAYKQIAAGDATDYSATGYDDSGWFVGSGPFGGGPAFTVDTSWARNTRLWLRREFPAASDVTIHVRVEDNCTVYVNGALVGATPTIGTGTNVTPGVEFTVPAEALSDAGNVIAVRCDDEPEDGGATDNTFIDVQIRGRLT